MRNDPDEIAAAIRLRSRNFDATGGVNFATKAQRHEDTKNKYIIKNLCKKQKNRWKSGNNKKWQKRQIRF